MSSIRRIGENEEEDYLVSFLANRKDSTPIFIFSSTVLSVVERRTLALLNEVLTFFASIPFGLRVAFGYILKSSSSN